MNLVQARNAPRPAGLLLYEYISDPLFFLRDNGARTRVKVERPEVVEELAVDLAAKDEELGADHSNGMAVAASRAGADDGRAGPLAGFCAQQLGQN